MTQSQYLFLGLTAIVAALAALLAYALVRFFAAARALARDSGTLGTETAFMASAMQEAVQRMRDQERAMKARAEASERLSSEIISSMTSGVLVVSDDGLVRTLNPAGRRLLGLGDGEPQGTYTEVLFDAAPLAEVVRECLQEAHPIVRRSVEMARPGGAVAHLGVTVSPIRGDSGRPHGAICLFTDLSDVVELEDQLRLKDSLARLGELTAGIAHEFRNGLATIHGYGRLLDLQRLPAEFRPYVQGIRDETEALGQIVTNFLTFAKPAELTLGPVNVRTIVDRVADDVRGEAAASGGDIVVSGEFGAVDGDEVLLRQAFSNLCRNAVEACVDASVAPRIVIEGAPDPSQHTLRIAVTDNGPGVGEAASGHIFRPFFTTKARGTGLGLALVQKIVVSHNGKVTAGNIDPTGARFVVTLPLLS